jgi:hypothetical protein
MMHGEFVKSERHEGGFNTYGFEWIRLNDVNCMLKLLLRHSQTFGILLRTFGVLLVQRS